jgi:glycosyltransferase involved in cell wall biosynthesis
MLPKAYLLSIVIPIYNERESLPELHTLLTQVLVKTGNPYEIIIVDDGSQDGSIEAERDLSIQDEHVVVIQFLRNFGKAAALQAGFEAAQGDVVITMDADLQDDPREIPNFLVALDEGFDMVSGWKRVRHDPLDKTLPSRFFNAVTSILSGLKLHDFNCGFKAYRRRAVKDLNLYGELHRLIPVLLFKKGYKVTEMPIRHQQRKYGKSKYGWRRFVTGFLDLATVLFITNYNSRPFHLFGLVGAGITAVGMLIDLYLTILWIKGQPIGERPLLMLGTLMIVTGVQILIFGLLSEMMNAMMYRRTDIISKIRCTIRNGEDTVTQN